MMMKMIITKVVMFELGELTVYRLLCDMYAGLIGCAHAVR